MVLEFIDSEITYKFQRAYILEEIVVGVWVSAKQSQDTVGGSSPSGSCQRLVALSLVPGVSVGSKSEIQEVRAAIKRLAPPEEWPLLGSLLLGFGRPSGVLGFAI